MLTLRIESPVPTPLKELIKLLIPVEGEHGKNNRVMEVPDATNARKPCRETEQLIFTCSKSTIEKLEEGGKYVQS